MPADLLAKVNKMPSHNGVLEIQGEKLKIDEVVLAAMSVPGRIKIKLSDSALKKIKKARDVVNNALDKKLTIYGLNTGFGSQAEKVIPMDEIQLLQRYLIISHSTGVGENFDPEIVRAAMIIRANTLSKGHSGVRPEIVKTLLAMLNKGVVPYVPMKGSLGASGDLAPLSHIALAFTKDPRPAIQKKEASLTKKAVSNIPLSPQEIKESVKQSGEAFLWRAGKWEKMTGIEAMAKAGISRVVLEAKEGLALNNGCSVSTAVGCFVVYYGERIQRTADLIASMSVEALKGFESSFSIELNQSRPHAGQIEVARRIREYLKGSEIAKHVSEIQNSGNMMRDFSKVQDSYSLRCIPQVHGAVLDVLIDTKKIIDIEINSATDNPLIFPDSKYLNKTFSGGNFHGEYVSLAMDHIGIATGVLGNISERRVFKMITGSINENLPTFLINPKEGKPGLMNGAMILQYTAASLASENKVLSHPASADSIPSSEDREDHVSMAPIAARKAYTILKNTEYILAIELWCAVVALRIRIMEGLTPGPNAIRIMALLEKTIPKFSEDRVTYDEIEDIKQMIHEGKIPV